MGFIIYHLLFFNLPVELLTHLHTIKAEYYNGTILLTHQQRAKLTSHIHSNKIIPVYHKIQQQ